VLYFGVVLALAIIELQSPVHSDLFVNLQEKENAGAKHFRFDCYFSFFFRKEATRNRRNWSGL
jgi:hypothetical protein